MPDDFVPLYRRPPLGWLVMVTYDPGESTQPWRAILGPPAELGRTTFGTPEEADAAQEALELRGYTVSGRAPVVAINDERLPL